MKQPTTPAFPSMGWDETGQFPQQFLGMSLRQWYVGQMLVNTYPGSRVLTDHDMVALFASADKLIKFESDEARKAQDDERTA